MICFIGCQFTFKQFINCIIYLIKIKIFFYLIKYTYSIIPKY